MARESVLIEVDAVDTAHAEEPWWGLAQQLKQDLASVILMSEADLQVLHLTKPVFPIESGSGEVVDH